MTATLLMPGWSSASEDVIINEFMAANGHTLKDEDGAYSDWIEIYNGGTNAVNMAGWALTDSVGNPFKWQFPATNIAAGKYQVVFASGKDRALLGGTLHASFNLSTSGEYLALVRPDGSVASAFSPQYPRQFPDVSFGLSTELAYSTVITTNAPARVLVPRNGNVDAVWTLPSFNDADWQSATNGVGLDTEVLDPAENSFENGVMNASPVGYWRFSETSGAVAANRGSLGAGGNGTYTSVTLGTEGPRPPAYSGFEPNNTGITVSGNAYVTTAGSIMSGRAAFTMAGWIRPTAAQAGRTGLFGQNDAIEFGYVDASNLQIWTPGGGSFNVAYNFPINEWHHITVVGDGASLRVYYDGNLAASAASATSNYGSSGYPFNVGGGGIFDTTGNQFIGQIDEVAIWYRALSPDEIQRMLQGSSAGSVSFRPYIATDMSAAMLGINSSAYIRIPFVLTDPIQIDRLLLRMRYDDGFVAYLNGQKALSVQAPATNLWNSAATASHSDSQAVIQEEYNLTDMKGLLTVGTNILAIQGLNLYATNGDFLVQAELLTGALSGVSAAPRYLQIPTPGAANISGSSDLGPIVYNLSHFPEQPDDANDIVVTAQVAPSFAAVTNVVLYYRVMFGVTNQVLMLDNGIAPDVSAGDGIYTAIIPASAASKAQMIQYFIQAFDIRGQSTRWPLFSDPTDSDRFMGILISDPDIQSLLPVFHLFVEDPAASETFAGTRGAIFYQGEYYDNIFLGLRGQSSSGWSKKGFNVDFTREHRFRYKPGSPRVKDIKVISNWGDKARMRGTLTYEVAALAGCDGHWSFPIRVQRNGGFHAVMDMMEDSDDLMLERLGRSPTGSFYKMYNNLSGAGGNEKKTRQSEDTSDLQALITALDTTKTSTERIAYAYDNIEIPQTISYFVALALSSSQDHGHKNFYLYRDTDGTKEWTILPWDVDLTWGRTWTDAIGYFDDTLYQDNILNFYNLAQQASKGTDTNRLYSLIMNVPDFRKMYLRRLRTVMDTVLMPANTPSNNLIIEAHIKRLVDLVDPLTITNSDADLDFQKWGYWGSAYQMRDEVNRIMTNHLTGRRAYLYSTIPNVNGELIPAAQPTNSIIMFGKVEYNPSSGIQDQEFIQLTNINAYAVDISGWQIEGGVQFTFKSGTVMPPNSILYVSPNVNAFRARTLAPKGGQNLYVLGHYKGQLSARGESLHLIDNSGRYVYGTAYQGTPSLAQQYLRISEIMFNPAPLVGNTNNAQEFEFIELKNTGPVSLNLSGVRFTNGVDFAFSSGTATNLNPGQTVLVIKNLEAFTARYGTGLNIAGQFSGSLDNAGERIVLLDAMGEEILDFSYHNSWYEMADGLGYSLVLVDDQIAPDAFGNNSSWRISASLNGSPGAIETNFPVFSPVLITEVLSHSEFLPQLDSIELHNPSAVPVDVGGWYLTDDFFTPEKYRIPANTIIAAGEYLVFNESQFNTMPGLAPSFALSSDGDEAYLFAADAIGNLTGYYHGFAFGAADDGVSFGRLVTSNGDEHFAAQAAISLGAPNSGPRIGPVVISELMYHPPDIGANDNSDDEYIELHNISENPVSLFDTNTPPIPWQLRGGVDYVFPTNVTLASDQYLLVVNFDPTNTMMAAAFLSKYNLASNTPLYGPYAGKLNNDSHTVKLLRPSFWHLANMVYVELDRVDYLDQSPWPGSADGLGMSLQRLTPTAFADEPMAWTAAPPSPGMTNTITGQPPVILTQPQSRDVVASQTVMLSVSASGSAQLRYQWRYNDTVIANATNAMLILSSIQPTQAGAYRAVVYNDAGSAETTNSVVNVLIPATILQQPQSVSLRGSTDPARYGDTTNGMATFKVSATSATPITCQWRFNGMPIDGATNTSLVVTNVNITKEGDYDVLITDGTGTLASSRAQLWVLVNPAIRQGLISQTNVLGSTITLSAEFTGNPKPYTLEWRKASTVVMTLTTSNQTAFFTLPNLKTNDAAIYRFVVKNPANLTPGVATACTVAVAVDQDSDKIPDSWELQYGFPTNNASNAAVDTDGDGMSNYAEFLAGTDPTNALSYLRVDFVPGAGTSQLQFGAISNRTYAIEFTDGLGTTAWQKLGEVMARTNNRVETLSDLRYSTNRFYRVRTPTSP